MTGLSGCSQPRAQRSGDGGANGNARRAGGGGKSGGGNNGGGRNGGGNNSGGIEGRGNRPQPGTRANDRNTYSEPRHSQFVRDNDSGHGRAEHGSQVTSQQNKTRVETSVKPSGTPGRETTQATSFGSDAQHARVLGTGLARGRAAGAANNGTVPIAARSQVVQARPGESFGTGWQAQRDASGQPIRSGQGGFDAEPITGRIISATTNLDRNGNSYTQFPNGKDTA